MESVWIKQLRQECYVIEMRAYIDADGAQDFMPNNRY